MDILNISAQEWVLNEEECLKSLLDPEVWDNVPLINSNELHNFKDGNLVRFRGMIQDMYGPGYYLEKFVVINESTNTRTTRNGKYCDAVVADKEEKIEYDSTVNLPNERQKYVVISVPGINAWVEHYECEKYRVLPKVDESRPTSSQNKRNLEEAMDIEDTIKNRNAPSVAKKINNDHQPKEEQKNAVIISTDHILNHPLGDEKSKVCHIQVYKDFEALKLNDTCEFVGFLSVNPITETLYLETEDDFENQMEIQTHHPPGSLVPRIHAVHFKNMLHNNPLVDNSFSESMNNMDSVKKELLIVLTQLLLGDSLAAEYLICHLISEVYLRRDFMPLGKLSLNISNIPKFESIDYVAEVYKFLELLVTKSHYLPLTLENMNTLTFTPKKDYECNRLTSGILQLSKNTLLLLDEVKLNEGKLDSAGIQAVKSLANAIKTQKVAYDFNYYPIEYDCDIQFLTFSEGKSMLPSDIHIPLTPDAICLNTFSEILEAARHFLKPELLTEIRKYLTNARLINYEISDQVQDLVQQEFVNMRQNNSSVTAEDLHRLLVLARLISLSQGKNTLDASSWKRALEMEQQRKARITK